MITAEIVTANADVAQTLALVAAVLFAGAAVLAGMARNAVLVGLGAGLAALSVAFLYLA